MFCILTVQTNTQSTKQPFTIWFVVVYMCVTCVVRHNSPDKLVKLAQQTKLFVVLSFKLQHILFQRLVVWVRVATTWWLWLVWLVWLEVVSALQSRQLPVALVPPRMVYPVSESSPELVAAVGCAQKACLVVDLCWIGIWDANLFGFGPPASIAVQPACLLVVVARTVPAAQLRAAVPQLQVACKAACVPAVEAVCLVVSALSVCKLNSANQRVVATRVDVRHVVPACIRADALVLVLVRNQTGNKLRHSGQGKVLARCCQKVVDSDDVVLRQLLTQITAYIGKAVDARPAIHWVVCAVECIRHSCALETHGVVWFDMVVIIIIVLHTSTPAYQLFLSAI